MSRTTVLAVWPGDRVEDLRELRNSWGSAPVVWDALGKKYLGKNNAYLFGENVDQLWALWERPDIPEYERAVLMMTFDKAYVEQKHFERAARDIRSFLGGYDFDNLRVNHWPEIASIFEQPPSCPAIGLYCTSVADNPFLGPWNEEKGTHDSIDWDDAYSVYEAIDELNSK